MTAAKLPELPPLPEPDGSATVVVAHQQVGDVIADVEEETPAWSAALIRAYAIQYAELAVAAERELRAYDATVLKLLVAGGIVSAEKVEEARKIAAGFGEHRQAAAAIRGAE